MPAHQSRARFRTHCPDCGQEVGATQEKFNRTGKDAQTWRRARHYASEDSSVWCVGGRTVVEDRSAIRSATTRRSAVA